jgi:hypothetical protein
MSFPAIPADLVHHERHRGAQFQAMPGGSRQGASLQRRSRRKTPLPGVEPLREAVNHAATRVVHGQGQFAVLFGDRIDRSSCFHEHSEPWGPLALRILELRGRLWL